MSSVTAKEPCASCKKNVATETWSSDMMSFVHGFSQRWCVLCCVQEQLDYALEAAARVEKLQKERDEAFRTVTPITDEEREAWYQTHPCSRFLGWKIAVVQRRPDGTRPGYDGAVQDGDVGAVAPDLEDLFKVLGHLREMDLLKEEVVIW